MGNFDKVKSNMKEAENLIPKQIPDGEGHVLRLKGNFEHSFGNYKEARILYKKAEDTFRKSLAGVPQYLNLGSVVVSQGNLEIDLENYSEARKKFKYAEALFQKSKDYLGESMVIRGLGDVYSGEGDYTSAINNYNVALERFRNVLTNPLEDANTLFRLGKLYKKTNQLEEARQFFTDALTKYKNCGCIIGEKDVKEQLKMF